MKTKYCYYYMLTWKLLFVFTSLSGQNIASANQHSDDIATYYMNAEAQRSTAYIPEPAASQMGYMGFKVGDKVKWSSPADAELQERYGKNGFITGTVERLDSNRCFIYIEHSNRVAVKLYEDIEQLNP